MATASPGRGLLAIVEKIIAEFSVLYPDRPSWPLIPLTLR